MAPPAYVADAEHGEPSAFVHGGGGGGSAYAAGATAMATAAAPATSTGAIRAIFAIMILVYHECTTASAAQIDTADAAVASRIQMCLLRGRLRIRPGSCGMAAPGTQAVPPPRPATAHGPPGIPAKRWPLGAACAPGLARDLGIGTGDRLRRARRAVRVEARRGGGSSAAAIGASAIADAAAPANRMDVIAFVNFAFMQIGYHDQRDA